MKAKKPATSEKLLYRLIGKTFTPLIVVSFLLASSKSYALVPDFAEVTNIQGSGISVNGQSASIGSKLSQYRDSLAVPAPYGNEKIFANLDLVKSGAGKLWIQAKAWNRSTTYYRIPCTINQPQFSEAEITWSNGTKTACGEGMHVTNNSSRHSNLPKSQTTQIVQAKNLTKNQFFLEAQVPQPMRLRYYCSSVPDSGRGSGHIAAGLTTIEEACQQSQETCRTNNGNECSIATMGEWSPNDQNLVMSITCADGKPSSKKVSGSEISAPGISNDALMQRLLSELFGQSGEIIGVFLGLKPQACYLQVYHPDEILISPIDTQQTSVVTTGLESGNIRVDVTRGQVKLRSVQEAEGILAKQGDSYVFNGNGEGSIYPSQRTGIRDDVDFGGVSRPTPPTPR
jgi:hypothetical protein